MATAAHEIPTRITAMYATCINANETARNRSMWQSCSPMVSMVLAVSNQRCNLRSRRQRRWGEEGSYRGHSRSRRVSVVLYAAVRAMEAATSGKFRIHLGVTAQCSNTQPRPSSGDSIPPPDGRTLR